MGIKRDSADAWFSDVVRKNAEHVCENCSKTGARMECAHIYGRAVKSVRWSMDNAMCLCHYCHLKFTSNPLDFTDFCTKKYGQGHLDILKEKWQTRMPTTKKLRAEIAKHYREEFKKMSDDPAYKPVSYN
jgi:hypothetical protein|tara:strand:- start:162 stop:551 length:390 start_codon:yes stop_codon:yes gene_type:complete